MFKILIWKNSKDIELSTVLNEHHIEQVIVILKERGLEFKVEDFPIVNI